VTVLTSFDRADLADLGYPCTVSSWSNLRVRKALEAGVDGIVCSPLESAAVARHHGAASGAGDARRALGRGGPGRSEARGHAGGSAL